VDLVARTEAAAASMRWILNNSSIASVSRLQSAIRSARSFWRRSREVSGDSISANEIDTTEPSWIYRSL
jgi:hypothetical protein